MRRIVAISVVPVVLGAAAGAAFVAWRRNPRFGSAFVNSVVNPRLVGGGLAGGAKSELGTLEHVGRTSGTRRLTPVHPEPTSGGFRVMVPLGSSSQWARNVLAAGRCRLQLHDTVYELDEPALIGAGEADHLPAAVRGVMERLGFQYLVLRTFASGQGSLEQAEPGAPARDDLAPIETPEGTIGAAVSPPG